MSRDWLAYFKAKRGSEAVICEGPEIEAACAEIDRLHSDYAALEVRHNALVEAARPLVRFAHALREVHKPYDQRTCTMGPVMAYVTSDQLDALAALVGEEES